jgi:hypothetical protein
LPITLILMVQVPENAPPPLDPSIVTNHLPLTGQAAWALPQMVMMSNDTAA